MSFDEKERKLAHNQVFNIQNFTGVLGDVTHSSIQIYDYGTIHQTLRQQNVPQHERNELENIKTNAPTLSSSWWSFLTSHSALLREYMSRVRQK